ncbi:MAG: hypothetical protein MJ094_04540 [Saccharofermentans sp.]|nr:hypothetical protein [Saccharofermentans sp.]
MHDYKQLALMIGTIEEKDLILYDMSSEDKVYAVKQFNRALINTQRDGTDVAQIILKPLITKYPTWGDLALVYGLCLARESQYKRALSALEYAVNNTLATEQHLAIAQEAMKYVKLDESMPAEENQEKPRRKRDISSMVGEADSKAAARSAMQAPILMRASSGRNDFKMASDKERRDIMMRSASGSDEMSSDDINVENVRTPADNLRLTVKIVAGVLIAALLFVLVYFVIIPTAAKVRNSRDTSARLDYIMTKLDENKGDPEVAGIIADYAQQFGADSSTSASDTTTDTQVIDSQNINEEV